MMLFNEAKKSNRACVVSQCYERSAMRLSILIAATIFAAVAAGCAGPNPNPGERTVDTAWTSSDFARAVEVLEPRAVAGEPWAQLRLGIFYENGWGVERDLDKAEYWYVEAAEQKAVGDWAEGRLVGAAGKPGFFNQNSDSRIAQFNLAQMYFNAGKELNKAKSLVETVIRESEGRPVFFCCEFAGGRSFTQDQFLDLKQKIDSKLAAQ